MERSVWLIVKFVKNRSKVIFFNWENTKRSAASISCVGRRMRTIWEIWTWKIPWMKNQWTYHVKRWRKMLWNFWLIIPSNFEKFFWTFWSSSLFLSSESSNPHASHCKKLKPYIAYCRIKNCDAVYRSTNLVNGAVGRRRQHETKHGVDDEYECHYCKATYKAYSDYCSHVKRCAIKYGGPKRPTEVKPTAGFYHIFI